MNAFKILGGAALALVLVGGLAAPAMAQKLDNKKNAPPAATTTVTGDIDFGDDSSEWANDGECDDPRFEGTGSAAETVDADILKDATDCQTAFDAGTVTLKVGGPTDGPVVAAAVDFGDNSSEWANDGECDDPRFEGTGSAAETVDADILKDATDCQTAFDAGTVTLKVGGPTDVPVVAAAVDFGDNSSEWANDGECDDPRFSGTGSATETVEADILRDAADCQAALDAGTVTFVGAAPVSTDIAYGDDTSEWAKDGECDDPRFSGTSVPDNPLPENIGHDATDCRAAVAEGTATYNGEDIPVAAFDYGSDWSKWANDGECDDLRFMGEGTDKKLLVDDLYGDATDCKALEAEGRVTIRTVYSPAYLAAAPHDSSHVDFGDNTSEYANDEECDDPRFEGPAVATSPNDTHLMHDAEDCRTAYEAGTVILISEAMEGM